jgi:hypothetical protein
VQPACPKVLREKQPGAAGTLKKSRTRARADVEEIATFSSIGNRQLATQLATAN